ncbi:glycosyltransferase family 2 protein [Oscillibacter ruminantium]|uniref:glycosyltransferase family 2 protein n=1 Tax=Oscillibacter ruminantium TaxID=1263547 RepID=UPI0002EF5E9B|nr:glycosyltransferase [Oscillibacter ruminantium]
MKVSVLMGVYNGADTVERAISSIFQQTFQDFECIVCDDGSTDDSSAVLCACQQKYGPRLVLLENEHNRGLAPTLNRCLAAATGAYIARMDADDVSAPERLERQVAFLQTHEDVSFVGCCAEKFDETGVYGEFCYPAFPSVKDLRWNACFIHPTVLFRREALEAARGYDEGESRVRCEDYDLWLRLYAMGHHGANLQEKLFFYYEGSGNLCKRKYRYRVNEAVVRAAGFRANKMLLRSLPYVVKPLLVGLLPVKLRNRLQKMWQKNESGTSCI